MKDKDIGSLGHTIWRCQYHAAFAHSSGLHIRNQYKGDYVAGQMCLSDVFKRVCRLIYW